jgi:ectoine hydroxylase-related dioxygenase (phytanoyl-CoA dioxygenase family)
MGDSMHTFKSQFEADGFFSPLRLVNTEEAGAYRATLENIERIVGPLHYRFKIHTVLAMAHELATNKMLLDSVEEILGPNILLYNATFIIKEPHTEAHVSWHQDLTYWGFNKDKQVAAWVALSNATEASGCMHMVPGSHKTPQLPHQVTSDDNNVLYHGQTVDGVCDEQARSVPLQAGEASLHHGWTLHTSHPNKSNDRRIGLSLNYISTDMFQTQTEDDSAMLVRGVDNFNHFKSDTPASIEFNESAWRGLAVHDELIRQTYSKMGKTNQA